MKIKNKKMDFMKSRICYKKKEHKMMDFMENKTKKMNFVIKKTNFIEKDEFCNKKDTMFSSKMIY